MAVSVAPLTTVVMESIDQDRAGTASGINNAVARVAGLLAIAVFGVVMVAEFSAHVNRSLATVAMPDECAQRAAIERNQAGCAEASTRSRAGDRGRRSSRRSSRRSYSVSG